MKTKAEEQKEATSDKTNKSKEEEEEAVTG